MKTDSALCVGCNKCIFECPTHANNAVLEDGENKIHVNNDLCIWCGECLEVCDHNARDLNDDTENFFRDLDAGEAISIMAAPALRHNIPEFRRLFGYLRQRGVKLIYDVSFGADITVWGYLKALEQGRVTMIAQPCPVIVRYLEHFRPELLPYLAPVQSPALCTAIYMKKYEGCGDKIALLSPCISKTVEFTDVHTGGYVTYNVTYKKLLHYLENQGIDLSDYEEISFDSPKGGLGSLFSRPGGLRENIQFYLGEKVWVKQVEGIDAVDKYLTEYIRRLERGAPVPVLVDALNCRNGCNRGTATAQEVEFDEIDLNTEQLKAQVERQEAEQLLRDFDAQLCLNDFKRVYSDKSQLHKNATEAEIEAVFQQLEKHTERERTVNCFSCGYGTCRAFASAVALGQNHVGNCFYYARAQLKQQREELAQKHNTIISSLNYASKIQRNLLPNKENMAEVFPEHNVLWYPKDIVGGDIYWLKNFSDGALLCVCDCTGHGTPGALLTMLVVSALDAVVRETNYKDTAYIIHALDQRMKRALNVVEEERSTGWRKVTDISDGADLALLFVSRTGEVTISAGNTHVFVCNGQEIQDIKGQRLRVGSGQITDSSQVRTVTIPANPGNKFYAASDGLFDQIGHQNSRPFGYGPFKKLILENHEKDMTEIFDLLWHAFESHRGNECRRDDVALVGFRP